MSTFKATSCIARYGNPLFRQCARCRCTPLLHRHGFSCTLLLIFLFFLPLVTCATEITLVSSTDSATAGNFQLSWHSTTKAQYILHEATEADLSDARIIYSGPDTATVISGKPNNTYYYRVTAKSNPGIHSHTIKVTVAHHPLENAFGFFTVGVIVFLVTLIVILNGYRQELLEQ